MNEIEINAGKLVECADGVELVEENISSHGRWNVYKEYIYKINDKFYRFDRSVGATEMQDDDSWSEMFVGWKDVIGVEVEKVEMIRNIWCVVQ